MFLLQSHYRTQLIFTFHEMLFVCQFLIPKPFDVNHVRFTHRNFFPFAFLQGSHNCLSCISFLLSSCHVRDQTVPSYLLKPVTCPSQPVVTSRARTTAVFFLKKFQFSTCCTLHRISLRSICVVSKHSKLCTSRKICYDVPYFYCNKINMFDVCVCKCQTVCL